MTDIWLSGPDPEPPIVFGCPNTRCKVFMFDAEDFGPCPLCCGRGFRLQNIRYEMWNNES